MKIQFLGTAASEGFPALFCNCEACKKARELGGKNIRTRSSLLIDDRFMIDFPPDTYQHILTQSLDLSKVEHLFITHSHSDHFYPEDIMKRKEPYAICNDIKKLTVYGNPTVESKYNSVNNEIDTASRLKFSCVQPYTTYKIDDNTMFTPLLADHASGETSLLYLFKRNHKCLLYGLDTGVFPEITWQFLKTQKIDVCILDCTCGKENSSINHMGFKQCVEVKNRLLRQITIHSKTKMVLTHFSHNGKSLYDELVKMAEPEGFIVAYDGLTLEI